MCLIIDANIAHLVFDTQPHRDFIPVWNWLSSPQCCLVYGGRLARELSKIGKARRYLRALDQAGKARHIPENSVATEQRNMIEKGHPFVSNDLHVIALARISSARLLCSHDQALHTDFKNQRLISRPKGKIYQNPDHEHLLRQRPSSCKFR